MCASRCVAVLTFGLESTSRKAEVGPNAARACTHPNAHRCQRGDTIAGAVTECAFLSMLVLLLLAMVVLVRERFWSNGWKYYNSDQMVGKAAHKPFLVTHRADWTKN